MVVDAEYDHAPKSMSEKLLEVISTGDTNDEQESVEFEIGPIERRDIENIVDATETNKSEIMKFSSMLEEQFDKLNASSPFQARRLISFGESGERSTAAGICSSADQIDTPKPVSCKHT